jgi:hypothetical protein
MTRKHPALPEVAATCDVEDSLALTSTPKFMGYLCVFRASDEPLKRGVTLPFPRLGHVSEGFQSHVVL